MTFEKFSKDCPNNNPNPERGASFCSLDRHKCMAANCSSFYVYKMLAETLEKLQEHCHYHAISQYVTVSVRNVAFEEEDKQ